MEKAPIALTEYWKGVEKVRCSACISFHSKRLLQCDYDWKEFFTVMTKLLTVVAVLTLGKLLWACESHRDYSLLVPEHVEFELDGKCYGIENQPRERMLITDCGGYLNVLQSTFTLGLSLSSERTLKSYIDAAKVYLDSRYEGCEFSEVTDLGGRIL